MPTLYQSAYTPQIWVLQKNFEFAILKSAISTSFVFRNNFVLEISFDEKNSVLRRDHDALEPRWAPAFCAVRQVYGLLRILFGYKHIIRKHEFNYNISRLFCKSIVSVRYFFISRHNSFNVPYLSTQPKCIRN